MSDVLKRCACTEARWPKCPHPWYMATFRYHGERYEPNLTRYAATFLPQYPTGTKTDADAIAEVVRATIRNGSYTAAKGYRPPPPPTDLTRTLDQVSTDFYADTIEADTDKQPNSKVNDLGILKQLRAFRIHGQRLGTRVMADIPFDDLIAYRRSRSSDAASTWNKHRTLLGQLWRWAKWKGHIDDDIITNQPKAELKRIKRGKNAQRVRRIDDTLYDNLKEAAREVRYGAVRLLALIVTAMETGCRVGELLALQWADVHRDQKRIWIRAEEVGASKTGRGRDVVISTVLDDVLAGLGTDPAGRPFKRSAYVFGDPYGERILQIRKAWNTCVLRAHNIEPVWTPKGALAKISRAALAQIDLHFHDFRHEAGCRWLESGRFDLAQVSVKLGHTSIAQTSTYLHPTGISMVTSQQLYDQDRAPQPQRQTAASAYKLPTNRIAAAAARSRARLVKGHNPQHSQ